ncbi:hypothetical protein BG015_012048, partial [Linnemannia schmuckeri]
IHSLHRITPYSSRTHTHLSRELPHKQYIPRQTTTDQYPPIGRIAQSPEHTCIHQNPYTMKSIKLALIAAVISVQALVEAGSYTLIACAATNKVHAWDSDGGYGEHSWTGAGGGFQVGTPTLTRMMQYQVDRFKRTARITYRGRTLKYTKPSDEVYWNGNLCYQNFGNY